LQKILCKNACAKLANLAQTGYRKFAQTKNTTDYQRLMMTAEYYRDYRVKRREKAAQKAAETVDIKADLKAALATCAALQKTIAARDATILHLEKLVSQLSVAQSESLSRIESGMQVLLARHALQPAPPAPVDPPAPVHSGPMPPWMAARR
jgi:hypothetical protein